MNVVTDASVWTSVLVPIDRFHTRSVRWVHAWTSAGNVLLASSISPAEVSGAVARRTGSKIAGESARSDILHEPLIRVVGIDRTWSFEIASFAAQLSLKGADASNVALASESGYPLVTWDKEQLERGGQVVRALTPEQAMKELL